MELINSSNTLTGKVPKLVETNKHLIMNTQVYDKQTLRPIPMKFFTFIPMSTAFMFNASILNTAIKDVSSEFTGSLTGVSLRNSCQRIGNHKNLIKDKYKTNILYLVSNYHAYGCISRIIENDNEYTIDKEIPTHSMVPMSNTVVGYDSMILYETETDFIVWNKGTTYYYNPYYNNSIVKLNKSSFSFKALLTQAQSSSTDLIYTNAFYMENAGDIGYILKLTRSKGFIIYKINSSTDQIIEIGEYIKPASVNLGSNPVKIGDYYYFLLVKYDSVNGYRYAFAKLKLDIINDTMSYNIIEISNYDIYRMNSYAAEPSSLGFDFEIRHQLQAFTQNGNVYLSCTIYGEETYVGNAWQHKQVLLKMTGDIIEIKQIIPLTDGCKGVLFLNEDYKKPIFVTTNSYLFYLFDGTKEKYINTFSKSGAFKTVGFDSLGRLITHNINDSIEILTETSACELKADFNEEIYDKNNNAELQTEVSFYAKNLLDEYIETSVRLTLIGSVVFQENNSKELITTTSKTGIITKPVIINGYGNIEIIITQNT